MLPSAVARRFRRGLHTSKFYIDGAWRAPTSNQTLTITNPSTGTPIAALAMGTTADADAAVAAAFAAQESWASTAKAERLTLLNRLASLYEARSLEMANCISQEMGAPHRLAKNAQTAAGLMHIKTFVKVLEEFEFEDRASLGSKEIILHEPLGVCACITPWNWPGGAQGCAGSRRGQYRRAQAERGRPAVVAALRRARR